MFVICFPHQPTLSWSLGDLNNQEARSLLGLQTGTDTDMGTGTETGTETGTGTETETETEDGNHKPYSPLQVL